MTPTLAPAPYGDRLARYLYERSEEARAVRVGEKEVSEQAAIVARYADLFTRDQLAALRASEEPLDGDEREQVYRLRKACEGGIAYAQLAERSDALENDILGARVSWRGEEIPLRTAQARLAIEPGYRDRDRLGDLQREVSTRFNGGRAELLIAGEEIDAELSREPSAVRRTEEEKGILLHELEAAVSAVSKATGETYATLRERWHERLLGPERDELPASSHAAWLRRLSPLETTYPRERSVPVCSATLREIGFDIEAEGGIKLDLEDRPQKSPRACVIASDPPRVVHLIVRAQGGLHDYAAFLHEAGHALHYAGCDPALPFAFRKLSRDHALTEIYSFIIEAISREPGWHARHFGLSDQEAWENAEATVFLESFLFRRYAAKLAFELEFWDRLASAGAISDGYSERLTNATGMLYAADGFLADMDAGFYSADYLRAWIRSAQLRRYLRTTVGEDWWSRPETGAILRGLFHEGTRPRSEDVALRLGFDPLDTGALVEELRAPACSVG